MSGDIFVRWVWIIVLVGIAALLVLMLTGVIWSDDGRPSPEEQQVINCVDDGGDPQFTDDRDGNVVTFFGCLNDG